MHQSEHLPVSIQAVSLFFCPSLRPTNCMLPFLALFPSAYPCLRY